MDPDVEMLVTANETTTLPALKILPSEHCDDINILMPVWCVQSTQLTQKFSLCSGKCSLSLCKDCARGVDFYTITDPNTARYSEHSYIVNIRNK